MDDGKALPTDPEDVTMPGVQGPSGSGKFTGTSAQTPPPAASDAATLHDSSPLPDAGSSPTIPPRTSSSGMPMLQLASVLGGRYQILRLLGEGGMGAVYQARDRELDRLIALKVIRPELAGNPSILQRFKQELILARHVTHKNVVRIYDLGEADGIRFITMEYVDGEDLRGHLREREKFSPADAVEVIQQVCRALHAAHTEGVIHRDLKPQNIMRDRQGRIVVMDFGLARSLSDPGMTQTGALVGTLEYMSPEQAMGAELDQRSDLYTVGLIFYELLTGKVPFKAESALASLMKRTQEQAPPVSQVDSSVPKALSIIVSRCLERTPQDRYASVTELLQQLEAWQANPNVRPSELERMAPHRERSLQITLPPVRKVWLWVGASALAFVLLLAIPATRNFVLRRPAPGVVGVTGIPDLSKGKYVAVLPLKILGDEKSLRYVADGLIEALSAKLFQLQEVHVASPSAVEKVAARDLPLNKVARSLGVNLIVQGTVRGTADKLRITLDLEDVSGGRRVWAQEFSGVPQDVLTLEDQIYAGLVQALELKPTNEELARSGVHPTENVEAYDLYLKGRNALRGSKGGREVQTAIAFFENALKRDPGFALAHSGLADAGLRMYADTKDALWAQKAAAAAQKAELLNANLPEVHLALGSVYNMTGKNAEAINELKRALALIPNSDEAYRRLAKAYFDAGRKAESIEAYQKAIAANPYFWDNHNVLGNAYFRLGETEKALQQYQKVTELAPDNSIGWSNTGAVYFREGKWNDAIPAFQKALELQPDATIYSDLGTTYFFLKRYEDAVKMFEKAVEMSPKDEQLAGNLADAYRWSGNTPKAIATYDKAIALAYQQLQVNPRSPEVTGDLALYYAKKGDAKNGLTYIRQARALDSADLQLIYSEAQVYALTGHPAEALRALRESFRKGYPPEEARSDPELEKLRSLPEFAQLAAEFEKKKPN